MLKKEKTEKNMTQQPNLKLVYFKMRALAEAPQLLMQYAGLSYDYAMS